MRIKNATVRSVELPSIEQIRPLIEEQEFHPLGESFRLTAGFEKNEVTGELVTPIPGVGYSFTLRLDEKIIPAAAVKAATEEKIKQTEAAENRKVGKKEQREIKDSIILGMIKTAPFKSKKVDIFFCQDSNKLVIASSSSSMVKLVEDKVISMTGRATRAASSGDWKSKITQDLFAFVEGNKEAFGEFNPGDSVSVKNPDMGKATFNPKSLDYANKGIKEAIEVGMAVDKIELEFQTLAFKVGGKDLDALASIKDFGELSEDEKTSREDLDKAELWRVESAVQVLMILATHNALIRRYAATKSQ